MFFPVTAAGGGVEYDGIIFTEDDADYGWIHILIKPRLGDDTADGILLLFGFILDGEEDERHGVLGTISSIFAGDTTSGFAVPVKNGEADVIVTNETEDLQEFRLAILLPTGAMAISDVFEVEGVQGGPT